MSEVCAVLGVEVAELSATVQGSASSTLPASNAVTVEPTKVSRVTVADPAHTVWKLRTAEYIPTPAGGAAIINHSCNKGEYRVEFIDESSVTDTNEIESCAPASFTGGSGVSTSLSFLSENTTTPDGDIGIMFGNDPNFVVVRFDDPSGNLKPGHNRHCFVLVVKVGFSTFPSTLSAQLRQNGGGMLADLGSKVVSTVLPGHEWVYFPFDSSVLTGNTNIELWLSVSPGGSSSTVATLVDAARMLVELDTARPALIHDSGWIDMPPGSPQDPTRSVHYLLDDNIDATGVNVFLRSDTTITYAAAAAGDEAVTHVDVGRILVGTVFRPRYGLMQGSLWSRVHTEHQSGRTKSGQPYSADAFSYRETGGVLNLTRAERDELMRYLDWRKGLSSPFYVAMEPGLSMDEQQFTAFYCTIDKAGDAELINAPVTTAGVLFKKSYAFKERL